MKPLVSIVCLCYNHEVYIKQALDGFVMQQTNFAFEIIVHDDASTDKSVTIIKEYEARYPDLFHCIYRKENWYSRKKDILMYIFQNEVSGKYIALCEGDDYWTDPYKLQKQADFLEAHPAYVMCSHRFDQYLENEQVLEKESDASFQGVTYDLDTLIYGKKWCTQTLTSMYRRDALDLELLASYKLSQDVVMLYALLKKGKGYCMPDIMGVYRVHSGGIWSGKSLNAQRMFEFKQRIAIYDVEKSDKAAMFLMGLFARSMSRTMILKQWRLFLKVIMILQKHYSFLLVTQVMFQRMVLGECMPFEKIFMLSSLKRKETRQK